MERIVRIMDGGIQDADRWLRIERSSSGICTLEFYDLALPRSQQMFFQIEYDAYLLDLAVAGCYSRMCVDGSSCSIMAYGAEVVVRLHPAGWPFEDVWIVPRSDFVAAVVGLTG